MEEYIDFSKITGFSEIFIDYINNFDKISRFYTGSPFSEQSWKKILCSITNQPYKREPLCKILKKQNKISGTDPETFENINSLKDENCFAVVTGQQPGIFTGPLYTIYKALTIIKLSESLKKRYSYNFVPVFWIETNDHDFEEVRAVNLIAKDKSLALLKYQPEKEFLNKPIAEITFDNEIDNFLKNFYDILPDNEFKIDIVELLYKCYQKFTSISSSFRMVMSAMFKGTGLILLDPSDPEIKNLASDIFLKIAGNWEKLSKGFSQTYQKLIKLGYHPEVKIKENSLNLFYHKSEERMPIYINNNNIVFGKGKEIIKREELIDKIIKNPENFSPNVLTRPIMQDFLLPTISYVAGPTEICYFSQIGEAYKLMEIPMPLIFPRTSITIIDKKIHNTLKEFDILPSELMEKRDIFKNKLTEKFMMPELTNLFQESEDNIKKVYQKISSEAEPIDITLKKGIENSFRKIFYQFNKIKDRFEKKIQEKHSIIKIKTEEINNLIFPNGKLQERKINVFTFISRYGLKFIKFLFDGTNIYSQKHQLLFLKKLSDKE
ncbi:MAG: bacillithiol biosynthesis cysteine-adding enzyme BshC [Candidatus Helarchaeota archaeon]|nr:bacillithiol biosynthesis cysteine-adding enzyme BshC [Candidatus Helarchaeota archaeon]